MLWKIISFFWNIFRPRISFWGLILPFVPLIVGTLLFWLSWTYSFRCFVRPYLLMKKFKNLNGARTILTPLLGIFWHFKRDEKIRGDFHHLSKKQMQEQPATRFIVSPYKDKLQIILYDTDLVKEFMAKEAAFTCKDPRKFKLFHRSGHRGGAFAQGEGDKRTSQREFIASTLNNEFITNFIPTIQSTAKEWIGHCFKESTNTADVVKKVRWFTAKIGTKLFFGQEGFSSPEEFKDFIKAGINIHPLWMQIKSSFWKFILGSKFHRFGLRKIDRQYNKQNKLLGKIYGEKIEQFRKRLLEQEQAAEQQAASTPQKSLLSMFLDSAKKSAKLFGNADIIGHFSTFFSAETIATASFLTSALYFLAKYKDVQDTLRSEIKEKYGKSESVSFETLAQMRYLDGFLKETLRMQPPTSLLYQRKVKENMNLLDLKLKKGDRVNVDILGIGHNPILFTDPTEFNPDRWLEKKDHDVKEWFAHLVFSAGSHKCPGQQLAMTEGKIFICELLQKFEISIEASQKVRLGFDFVYHIKSPLELTFTKV